MGLDMYLRARTSEELAYWRKHNALQHWMEQAAIDLGIVKTPDEFNCIDLPLTPELLDRLEADIKEHKLEPISGFFFGATDYDPAEYEAEDLNAIKLAREAIAEGKQVIYTSWW
jgi:hypothetical protein